MQPCDSLRRYLMLLTAATELACSRIEAAAKAMSGAVEDESDKLEREAARARERARSGGRQVIDLVGSEIGRQVQNLGLSNSEDVAKVRSFLVDMGRSFVSSVLDMDNATGEPRPGSAPQRPGGGETASRRGGEGSGPAAPGGGSAHDADSGPSAEQQVATRRTGSTPEPSQPLHPPPGSRNAHDPDLSSGPGPSFPGDPESPAGEDA